MYALRALSRGAARIAFKPVSLRSISSVPKFNSTRSAWQTSKPSRYPAFSTSIARKESAGESDLELSEKLNLERQLELDSRDTSKVPASIEDFLQNSPFEVQDKPGTHEVILTREFGNETIKIEFSINDMNQIEEADFDSLEEDGALGDEADFEQPKRTINQSGTKGGKIDVVAEDSIAPSDREGDAAMADADTDLTPSYPLNLVITITKPNNKAIEIRAQSQDGAIDVEGIHYFPQAELIDAATPEAAREASTLYAGPVFSNLDPDLQAMVEVYLEERGVNAQLATFLPEYIEYKEQREYVEWLQNMKDFVDA